jgi:hypothetical protein
MEVTHETDRRTTEIRKMRFKEAYDDWQARRLNQEEAARLLGGDYRSKFQAV